MTDFSQKTAKLAPLWSSFSSARPASTTRVTALYRRVRFFAIEPAYRRLVRENRRLVRLDWSWCRITAPGNGNGLADACKIVTVNGTIGCPNRAAANVRFEAAPAPLPSVEYASVTVYSVPSLQCDEYSPAIAESIDR
jgi:hypothetical protein